MPDVRTGTITEWSQLSPVLARFRLAPERGHPFPSYEAGQYMALRREDCRLTRRVKGPDGRPRYLPDLDETGRQKRGPVTHVYSLASAPFQTEAEGYVEFLVVLELASTLGRFTESLFDLNPRRGSSMRYVERIVGDFTLARRRGEASGVVMVAMGTGIAPLVSMIRQVDHAAGLGREVVPVTLFYANRTWHELAFHRELVEIAAARRFDFTYVPSVSRPGDEQGKETVGRGRANNVFRMALGLPMAEEEALQEAQGGGGAARELEAAAARAVPPHLPRDLDPAALRSRMDPASTVVLMCGNPRAMQDVRRAGERVGLRVEREEW
jgi:ferredoxin-NADP reductase